MVKLNADNAKTASEVSQNSSKSAESGESEIKNLIVFITDLAKSSKEIQDITSAANDITKLIQLSVSKNANRVKAANQSGLVLSEIVTSVKKVAALNNQIALASRDQADGLNQINMAMNQLDAAIQANASSANQSAQSSEAMPYMTVFLKRPVNKSQYKL